MGGYFSRWRATTTTPSVFDLDVLDMDTPPMVELDGEGPVCVAANELMAKAAADAVETTAAHPRLRAWLEGGADIGEGCLDGCIWNLSRQRKGERRQELDCSRHAAPKHDITLVELFPQFVDVERRRFYRLNIQIKPYQVRPRCQYENQPDEDWLLHRVSKL